MAAPWHASSVRKSAAPANLTPLGSLPAVRTPSSGSLRSCRSTGTTGTKDSGIFVEERMRGYEFQAKAYASEITSSGRYSCPYRKRNPHRFNTRSFPNCAFGSFSTISEVERHVIRDHKSKDFAFRCQVCTSRFRRWKDFDNHFNTQPCRGSPTVNEYEVGINDAILATLQDHRKGSWTWDDLWDVLFPDCDPVTPDFIPPRSACEEILPDAFLQGPVSYGQVDASTQTPPQDSDQSTAIRESRPLPSLHLQQETPECQTRPTVHYTTAMPRMNASLQQVGLARVHVEILSLSEQHRRGTSHQIESLDGSASETGSEGSDYDACSSLAQDSDGSPGDTSTGAASTVRNTSQGQASASPPAQSGLSRKRGRTDETEDDGADSDRPGKRRRRRQPQPLESARGRFACPYQAYDLGRDCFKPSQRNPKGGCDSVSRLKDHMTRKHMLSYRCPRCWRQFNARHKAMAHPQGSCVQKEMPTYEWFMALEQETEVENCVGTEPEDTWWKLFRLLIPGMAAEDLLQLKGLYFPYYVHVDRSLTIPSLNIPTISFEDAPAQSSGQPNAFPSDALSGLGNTSLTLQSFAVPIYGAATRQPPLMPSFEAPDLEVMAPSSGQQSVGPDSTTSSDGINMLSTPASSLNPTPERASRVSQMQRNYDRQKTRASQAEAENGELRATISASRQQVGDAAGLLEGILAMENLNGEVFEQVSRAADILMGVTGRLR